MPRLRKEEVNSKEAEQSSAWQHSLVKQEEGHSLVPNGGPHAPKEVPWSSWLAGMSLGKPAAVFRHHFALLEWGVVVPLLAFAFCSSTMLVANKVAISLVPAPSLLLLLQLSSAAASVKVLSACKVVEADALEWQKVRKFWFVAVAFLAALFANIKTLQYANVETFIVIKSTTPLVICVMDWIFLGRQLPSARSCASLFAIVVGAIGYVLNDSNFQVRAYTWVCIWLLVFTFDQIYIKHVVDTVEMTTWGRVYYTNLIASIPVLFIGIMSDEWSVLAAMDLKGFLAIAFSCVLGVAMNYSAFTLRKAISATSFTVVGTLCKILSVIVNIVIWDKHATTVGLVFLYLCILSGTMYQQAPLRSLK